jgi:hypothetical protein
MGGSVTALRGSPWLLANETLRLRRHQELWWISYPILRGVTLQPGVYKVYCPIGSHASKGMAMTLAVGPP